MARIDSLLAALRDQESTNNYQMGDQAGSGVYGAYQFQQETWDDYVAKAGYSDYVGVEPDQAPPEVQDATARAELEENLQRYGGDERYTILAHYGGQGAADSAYNSGSIPESPEYYNGQEYPSQLGYVNEVIGKADSNDTGANGHPIDWDMPVQDGIEDVGLAHSDQNLVSAVKAFGSFVHSNDGIDLAISGGWRSQENNDAVNGSPTSHHLEGQAIDVVFPDGVSEEQVQQVANTAFAWGFNSDGESIYHDKGSGYHLHLTLPTGQLTSQGANWFQAMSAGYSPESVQSPGMGALDEIDYKDMYNNRPFGEKLSDTFFNMWYDNGTIGMIRNALVGTGQPSESGWRPTDADIALLDKALGDNTAAKQAVLSNSASQQAFNTFLAMKIDDVKRQQRAEITSFGLHSILGGLGGMLLDPMNLIPYLGDGALMSKAVAGLSLKALGEIGENRLMRIAGSALEMGTANMADAYLAEHNGSRQANYAESFVLGAAGAAGVSALRHYVFSGGRMTPELTDLASNYGKSLDTAAMKAMDVGNPEVIKTDARLRGEPLFRPQQTIVPEGITAVSPEVTESALRNMMGITPTLSRKVQKAADLTDRWFRGIDPNMPAQNIMGMATSSTLRKLGLPADSSVRDVLQHLAVNPQDTKVVQKVVTKYTKSAITDDSFNRLIDKYSTRQSEDYTGLAIQALSDGEGSQTWKQIKRLTGINDNTDLRDSLKQVLYRKTGVTYSEDGTNIVVNGLKNTEGSPLYEAAVRPEVISDAEHIDPVTDEPTFESGIKSAAGIRKESQVFKSRIMRFIGQKAQSTKYLGNTYGHFVNSPSNNLRGFGKTFLTDPRFNPERLPEGGVDFSQRKNIIFRSMQDNLAKGMQDGFTPWFAKHMNMGLTAAKTEFGRQVTQTYDEIYKHHVKPSTDDENILNMVNHLSDLRQQIQSEMKRSGMLKNTIEDTGLWRKVDPDKLSDLIRTLGSRDAVTDQLAKYGKTFADRDAYEKMYNAIPEEERLPSLEDFIESETRNWAFGIVDRGLSDAHLNQTDLHQAEQMEEWLRRAPIDTRGIMQLPDGMPFNFDNNLRDLDVYRIARRVIDRTASSIALRDIGITDMSKYFADLRTKVNQELDDAVQARQISQSSKRESLEEFDWAVSHSIGRPFGVYNGGDKMSKLARLLTKQSYAQNGYNMGLNQISENFNAIGITGTRAITNMLPGLRKVLRSFRDTPLTIAQADRLRTAYHYGNYTLFNPMNMSVPQAERIGLLGKAYGKTADALDFAGDITTAINRISSMTNNVISVLEVDVFEDLLHWAGGGRGTSYVRAARNMESAGIKDIPAFKKVINDTFSNLDKSDPDAVIKAMDGLKDAHYDDYVRLRAFTQQASNKAILQPTISNSNYFTKKGTLAPIIMQFQNFSRMALDSHLMRGLEHWDKEVTLGLIGSGVAAGLLWYARTYLYGLVRYQDAGQRQAFYDQILTPSNLLRAGFFRSALLAGVSPINDWYEAATGAGTIRTTVQRKSKEGFSVGGAIAQYPAIKALQDDFNIMGSGMSAIHDSLMQNQVYQDDMSAFTRAFPIDKWVGTQLLMTQLGMHKGDTVVNTYPKRPSGMERVNTPANALAAPSAPKTPLNSLLKGSKPVHKPQNSVLDKLLGGN